MKGIKFLVLLVFIVLSTSCGKQPPPMERDLLINILMDVHLAEGLINGHHPASIKDTLQKRYLAQILEKWNVSEGEFENALSHMHGDPDYSTDVYDRVLDRVEEYADELDEQNAEEEDRLENK